MIKLSSDLTKFQATSVKFYHENNIDFEFNENSSKFVESSHLFIESRSFVEHSSIISQFDVQLNIDFEKNVDSDSIFIKKDHDRSRKYFALITYLSFMFNINSINFVLVTKFDSIKFHTALSQFAAFKQKQSAILLKNMFFKQSINTTCNQMFVSSILVS